MGWVIREVSFRNILPSSTFTRWKSETKTSVFFAVLCSQKWRRGETNHSEGYNKILFLG
ncbi:MAG: hypothetical protein KTR25_12130 [Myxococcales bacterium]|nr:hypothetical protein [Myxococcales bacterium]